MTSSRTRNLVLVTTWASRVSKLHGKLSKQKKLSSSDTVSPRSPSILTKSPNSKERKRWLRIASAVSKKNTAVSCHCGTNFTLVRSLRALKVWIPVTLPPPNLGLAPIWYLVNLPAHHWPSSSRLSALWRRRWRGLHGHSQQVSINCDSWFPPHLPHRRPRSLLYCPYVRESPFWLLIKALWRLTHSHQRQDGTGK